MEGIRKYVCEEHLGNPSTTTVDYVWNLLSNYNSLINVSQISIKLLRPHISDSIINDYIDVERSHALNIINNEQISLDFSKEIMVSDYDWNEETIPYVLRYSNPIYYINLWKFVNYQLLSKQTKSLWLLLGFITKNLPTINAVALIEQHKGDLAKCNDLRNLDNVLMGMIETSSYPIATALLLSSFMLQLSEQDISREKLFTDIAEKYVRIADRLVAAIESDHLLSLLLNIPTDYKGLSILEIGLQKDLADFFDNNRVDRIITHQFTEYEMLQPNKSFRTNEIDTSELFIFLVTTPAKFFYSPIGKYFTWAFAYFVYIIVVTIVVIEAPCVYVYYIVTEQYYLE